MAALTMVYGPSSPVTCYCCPYSINLSAPSHTRERFGAPIQIFAWRQETRTASDPVVPLVVLGLLM